VNKGPTGNIKEVSLIKLIIVSQNEEKISYHGVLDLFCARKADGQKELTVLLM